mgnify:CR=1 FL=1
MTQDLLAPVLARIDAGLDQSVERLVDVLRIPSISTDPKYTPDVRRAAEWMAAQLSEIGFDAAVRDAKKHPMVVGHFKGPEGAPHLLYYGHYDVQPADPYELWDSDPFEPQIVEAERGKRIVARGAVDDKGQVMTFLEACRAFLAVTGSLPIGLAAWLAVYWPMRYLVAGFQHARRRRRGRPWTGCGRRCSRCRRRCRARRWGRARSGASTRSPITWA